MVELVAKDPTMSRLPLTYGSTALRAVQPRRITSVAPFKGATQAVSDALMSDIGVRLPEPGKLSKGADAEIAWTALGQFFVLQPQGAPQLPSLAAAVTDQSDGWVSVQLDGQGAEDVMARLCPLDLRAVSDGDAVRSLIGHMNAVILRRADGFELMVFRSMAQTLLHELDRVMRSVAAQASQQS